MKQKANAQNQKAISENATWITAYPPAPMPSDTEPTTYVLYKTGSDTIIHGLSYVKLLSEPVSSQSSSQYTPLGYLHYSYAFRNDTNNRAYIIPAHDSVEHLWYNFNLAVGDTVYPRNPQWYSLTNSSNPGDIIIVTSIDSAFYCNRYNKAYTFNYSTTNYPRLVKDVGFVGDLINHNSLLYFSYLVHFCCDTSDYNCNLFVTGVPTNTNAAANISIYPNPTTSSVKINLSGQDFGLQNILIRDITGKLLRTVDNVGNEKTIPINLKLPSGLYLIELQGTKNSFERLISVVN